MVRKYCGPRSAAHDMNMSDTKTTKDINIKRPLVEDEENKSSKHLVIDDKQIKLKKQLLFENNNTNPKEQRITIEDKEVKPKKQSQVNPDVKDRRIISKELVQIENKNVPPRKRKEYIISSKGETAAFHSKLDDSEDTYKDLVTSSVGSPENALKIPPLKIIINATDSDMNRDNKNDNQSQNHSTLPLVKNNDESVSKSPQSVLPISPKKVITTTNSAVEDIFLMPRLLRSFYKSISNNSNAQSHNTSPIVSVKHPVQTTIPDSTTAIDARNNKQSVNMAPSSICELSESNLATDFSNQKLNPKRQKIKTNPVSFSDRVSAAEDRLFNLNNVPFHNSYQMYLDLRREINDKHKNLFSVRPKPPSGFKDYLMNKHTYHLHGSSNNGVIYAQILPPADLHEKLKLLFTEQENERHELRLQHMVQKEKLVLSIEQEILRVHGLAARELVNQPLPFSVCTILKDEEVYSKPKKKDQDNTQCNCDGSLFLSWLQEVDDKWENIKEVMIIRHHNEAESLHAVQKMNWGWKMKELQLCSCSSEPTIDRDHVPIVFVADNFDLLPA